MTLSEIYLRTIRYDMSLFFYNWSPNFDRHVFQFFLVCLFSLFCFLRQLKSFLEERTANHISYSCVFILIFTVQSLSYYVRYFE